MESLTKLTLNLQLPNCAVTMYAVQNDRLSRKVQATLLDGDTAWTPPASCAAIVRFVKPDGTKGFYDSDENGNDAVTWTGNVATIMLAEQALTVAGDVYCQLNFYTASEEKLTTFTWLIKVQKSVVDDETIESTDYYNALTTSIAEIEALLVDLPFPATETPLMDGTAAVGLSNKYAREDHRHPTDTTLLDAINNEVTARGNADTALQGQITAYVETTSTASRAYTTGDIIAYNGTLYIVTANIASGGTLTPNTNIVAQTATQAITTISNSIFARNVAGNGQLKVARQAGTTFIFFAFRGSNSANPCIWLVDQWGSIATLHAGDIATIAYNSTIGDNGGYVITNTSNAYLPIGYIALYDHPSNLIL